ncbi:unnamed protein product [Chrysoparadoxa australica]
METTWPAWAIKTLAGSASCCALACLIQQRKGNEGKGRQVFEKDSAAAAEFARFQMRYLRVFFLVMLADWLQGTTMWELYQSYGVNVGTLFLTGFSSSAIFGTFLGLFVDKFGRRAGCMVFCVLEIIINTLEHFPSMPLLVLGRILGGMSTSLLFSAFESWMVAEHRQKGFPEEWLASTFALCTAGNGIVAILAGLIAQVASDALGEIGPFQVAILLTIMALGLLFTWEENYGSGKNSPSIGKAWQLREDSEPEPSFRESINLAGECIRSDSRVLLLGLVQSLFEGAMYTFVFMWVPMMLKVAPDGILPTGLVFSSFMVCVTLGGIVFSIMLRYVEVEVGSFLVFVVAAMAMAVPIFMQDFYAVLGSFLAIETCVGAFYACSGLMRSKYLPDALQSSIMNLFRLPLNVFVVVGTRMSESASPEMVFTAVSVWFAVAAILQRRLCSLNTARTKSKAE